MQWLIPINSTIAWSTAGKGSTVVREGVVIAHIPSGASVRAIVGDRAINRNVKDVSRFNRYAIEVVARNGVGNPYQDGRMEILTPVKEELEKIAEISDG
jgi:hypothetical protein